MSNEHVKNAGETLIKAYVSLKAGETQQGFRYFSSLKGDDGLDQIMDGVAKAMLKIKAGEDEEDLSEYEEVPEEDLESETEELENEIEDEPTEDEEEEIDVPASVVQLLGLA